jgi:hypothetical protein
MKWKLLALVTCAFLVIPLALLTPGCSGPDNPKIADAPPPPPPKPAEIEPHSTKVGGKPVEYGSHPKYKKAMDRLNK